MFDTVLVGYEGSERSEDALTLAQALAPPGARIIVASHYWYEPAHARVGKSGPGPAPMREVAEETLAPLRERLGDAVEPRAIGGSSAAHTLHELAEAEGADLIVVGSTRAGGVRRALLSSTAERLLHGASCAVAVAPAGFHQAPPESLGRIGVAYCQSPEAELALAAGQALAEQRGASLEIIAVFDLRRHMLAAEDDRWVADCRRALVADVEARPGGDAATVVEVVDGDPVDVLRDRAAELDLLVMGSRAYGPVRRVMLGGVSHELLSDGIPCPVLITPRGIAAPAPPLPAPGAATRVG